MVSTSVLHYGQAGAAQSSTAVIYNSAFSIFHSTFSIFHSYICAMINYVEDLNQKLDIIHQGGGAKAAAKQKEKGKMLARERIEYLLDKDMPSIEIGSFAAYEMYEKEGGCPAAGVIVKIGYVSGRQCIVLANDATVKAGAWFPMTGKKNLRAQEIALENR